MTTRVEAAAAEPSSAASEADAAAARDAIAKLAAGIGCNAWLLPQQNAPREQLIDLIEQLAQRLNCSVELLPAAEAPAPRLPRSFTLTERDREILRAVARYRYLRTGQVCRLLFAPTSSMQMARRRLRLLASDSCRYLRRVECLVRTEGMPQESAYYLAPAGISYLTDLGDTPPEYALERQGRVRHRFLEHALALSEFRLLLELALRRLPFLTLRRFVPDFEVKEHLKATGGKERFKLYYAFPSGPPRRRVVYPDAMIVLAVGDDKEGQQRLFFVEIDRGTESHGVICDKVFAYERYLEAGIFRKFGAFPRFRVLLQTHSPRRARLLRETLASVRGGELVWIAAEPDLTPETILTGAVWTDAKDQPRSIVRQG